MNVTTGNSLKQIWCRVYPLWE